MGYNLENKELQEKWDKMLLDVWMTAKGASMWIVIAQFKESNSLQPNVFLTDLGLKRVPQYKNQNDMDIFGFMALTMPQISNWLIDTKKEDKVRLDKIYQAMQKVKHVNPMKLKGIVEVKEYSRKKSEADAVEAIKSAEKSIKNKPNCNK